MNLNKVKKDIYFYFWLGLFLYITATVLNIIHLYQIKGRDPIDFLFHLLLLGINITLLSRLKEISNLARNIYLVKFVFLCLTFYPIILFVESGTWVYSQHWPHGVLQRVFNAGVFLYEIFFAIYLSKRAVRFVFVHRKS